MNRWFRHYTGTMRDPKFVTASVTLGVTVERVTFVWCALLESAADCNDGGRFDTHPGELARFLQCNEAGIEAILVELQRIGIIDGKTITKWGKRQYEDNSNAVRQRRFRDKKKNDAESSALRSVTDDRYVTPPETETETEKKDASLRYARASDEVLTTLAYDLTARLHAEMGWAKEDPRAIGNVYRAQKWLNSGWDPDLCVTTVQQRSAGRSIDKLVYFEKAIAEAHAELRRPVPVVNSTPEVVNVYSSSYRGQPKKPGIKEAIDARIAALEREQELGGGQGDASPPRLLSHGRG